MARGVRLPRVGERVAVSDEGRPFCVISPSGVVGVSRRNPDIENGLYDGHDVDSQIAEDFRAIVLQTLRET